MSNISNPKVETNYLSATFQPVFRLAIFFLLTLFLNVVAGQTSIRFSHLTTKDGLSQNSVLCIHQDSYGFMWFGTRDGLNIYDGITFKSFYHNYFNSNTLSSSYINHISEDSTGDLWISTTNGLNRYIRDSEEFERYFIPDIVGESYIFCSYQDSAGTLWVGASEGLYIFDWEEKKLTPYHFDAYEGDKPETLIKSIFENHKGQLLFGTFSDGLFIYDQANSQLLNLNTSTDPSLNNNNIESIIEDDEHKIWLATNGGGVNIWDPSTGITSSVEMGKMSKLSSNVIRDILKDKRGRIWIGTFNGLYIYDPVTDNLDIVESNQSNPYSLNNNAIRCLYQDRDKAVWTGTYFGGINIYNPINQRFKHHTYTPDLEIPLDYNPVSAIVEDENLNLWIGTDRGGLNHYNYDTKQYSYYLPDNDNANDAEPMFTIKSLLLQNDDVVWVGTHRRGLYRFDIRSQQFTRIFQPGSTDPDLSNSVINSMSWDQKGFIWLSTKSYGGLYKFDPDSEKIVDFQLQDQVHEMIADTDVRSILQDNFGNNWIATRGKGIIIFNEETNYIDQFYHDKDTPHSLRSNHIYQIKQDDDGDIWVVTDGAGIGQFDRLTRSFDFSFSQQGLLHNKVLGVLKDSLDNLWFSTNKGISRYHKKDSVFHNYDYESGLPLSELTEGAYHRGKYSGNLYFGGVDGFIEIDPYSFSDNNFKPSVLITGFKLFGDEVKPEGEKGVLDKSILNTKEIQLKYNQSIFTIDFVALNYTHSDNNQYAYMLEGLENSWNYVEDQNFATYTLLNSGTYTFKVKASNNDGLWNEDPTTLRITILPPPWRSWWAYIIYIFLLVMVLYTIRYFVLKNQQYKNSTLINEMQKMKLQEINEAKIDFFTNVSHELRTPLTLIIAPFKELIKDRSLKFDTREKISLIVSNAQLLDQMVDRIMDFRKLETGKEKLGAANGDWVVLIRKISAYFHNYASYRNIHFNFKSTQRNIYGMLDSSLAEKMLFNLISHAFKSTPDKGKIKISASKEKYDDEPVSLNNKYAHRVRKGNPFPVNQEVVLVNIEDNGVGLNTKDLEKIFDKFYDIPQRISADTGIGLYIVKNVVALHHGCIEVSSEKNKGTIFSMIIPLEKSYYLDSEIIETPEEITSDYYNPLPVVQENKTEDETVSEDASKILIIEDHPGLTDYLKSILRNEYHVFTAISAKNALRIMRNSLPDLILCDIAQKPEDVIKLCKRIKKIRVLRSVPFVIITSDPSEDFKIKSYEAGANAFIVKPFAPDLLKVRIRNLIEEKKKLPEPQQNGHTVELIADADEKLLLNINDMIRKNISDVKLSVESLSKMVGLSRAQFYRKIKTLTGLTVVEYIRNIRIEESANLLRQEKLSIKEVAGLTGFTDLDYFRNQFKKKYGTTPSNFIEQERNKKK